jgi:hypothetical protein
MTQLRTIHAGYEKLDPTEYTYVTSFDSVPEPGSFMGTRNSYEMDDGTTVEANNGVHAEYVWGTRLLAKSDTSVWDGSGQCDHCGAHLRYVVVMRHEPTGTHMAIGETCHYERFDYDSKVAKDVDRLRKRAAAGRLRSQVRKMHEEWVASDERNGEAVAFLQQRHDEDEIQNDFFESVFMQLNKKGTLSERQVDAVLRSKAGREKFEARKAAEADEPKIPVVEGRQQLVGTILKMEFKDDEYGGRTVMTVKEDRGFLVWGTCPANLAVEKGDRIKFQATVTKSDRDEHFGFFKRPSKAVRVGEVA